MSFALPQIPPDLVSHLRDLEQNAAQSTSKEIRAALLQAAQEMDRFHLLAAQIARELDEVSNIRISEMASTSAVSEIQRGIKRTLSEAARRLREK